MFQLRSQSWTNLAVLPPPQGKMNHNQGFHNFFCKFFSWSKQTVLFFCWSHVSSELQDFVTTFLTKNMGVLLYSWILFHNDSLTFTPSNINKTLGETISIFHLSFWGLYHILRCFKIFKTSTPIWSKWMKLYLSFVFYHVFRTTILTLWWWTRPSPGCRRSTLHSCFHFIVFTFILCLSCLSSSSSRPSSSSSWLSLPPAGLWGGLVSWEAPAGLAG